MSKIKNLFRKLFAPKPSLDMILLERLRKERDATRKAQCQAQAYRGAAIHIIKRFDGDGSLYRDLEKEYENRLSYLDGSR